MADFKNFLLNEQKEFLAQKIGDVLSAVQNLKNDSKQLGDRNLANVTNKTIMSKIRAILNGQWPSEEMKHLKDLQAIGFGLASGADANSGQRMTDVLAAAETQLEALTSKLGSPINSLATTQPIPQPPSAT